MSKVVHNADCWHEFSRVALWPERRAPGQAGKG